MVATSLRLSVLVAFLLMPAMCKAAEPKHSVEVRLIDSGPTAARVSVTDSSGAAHAPEGTVTRKGKSGASWFYADRQFEIALPDGSSRLQFSGGIETVPQTVEVTPDKATSVDVRVRPWINMAARGWYSGDSHVHLHTGGPLNVDVADALLAARAEGVNFVNLCVSNNVGDDIRDADLITGKPHARSTTQHLLVFGEEMRSSIYGHMQFFGIKRLVEPQYTGFDNTPGHHDYPANYVMAAEAVRQGGVVTYGHPMFKDKPDPFDQDLAAGNAAARELPIDAILGACQAVDLMCYNSDEDESARLWYRLLNCGLKLSACAGTDALLDRSTDPLGGERVYVKIDGDLTMQSWLDGLKRGRTFVTNGPMPSLTVNDRGPGETVSLGEPGTVSVSVKVESHVPVNQIDVLVNGQVASERRIATGEARADQSAVPDVRVHQFQIRVPVERSSWIALRVRGPQHESLFDGPAWAHTSPVFVIVAEQPITSRDDAAYFVEWIDQLLRVVAVRNRYPSPDDRMRVEELYRKARAEFQKLAGS